MLSGLEGLVETLDHDDWDRVEHDHVDVVWKVLEVVIEIERIIFRQHRLVVEGMDKGCAQIFVSSVNVAIDTHIAAGQASNVRCPNDKYQKEETRSRLHWIEHIVQRFDDIT